MMHLRWKRGFELYSASETDNIVKANLCISQGLQPFKTNAAENPYLIITDKIPQHLNITITVVMYSLPYTCWA